MHRFLVAVDYILPERSIKYFLFLVCEIGYCFTFSEGVGLESSHAMVLFLCLAGGSQRFLVKLIFDLSV